MASKDTHLTKDPNQLISTGAFPASEKIFVSGNLHPHIKVPMKKSTSRTVNNRLFMILLVRIPT